MKRTLCLIWMAFVVLSVTPAPASAKAPDYGDPTFVYSASLTALANTWAARYNADLGITLGSAHPYKIVAGTSKETAKNPYVDGNSSADSGPLTNSSGATGGTPSICIIRVLAQAPGTKNADIQSVISHEVFHCFEFYFLGSRVWNDYPNPWVMEGLASWGEITTVGAAGYTVDDASLLHYIEKPTTPLFDRAYDAAGFWGHVQDIYGNLWSLIPQIFAGPTDDLSIFNLVGGNDPRFLSTWGSSVWRLRQSSLWNMVSPVELWSQTTLPEAKIATADSDNFSVPAYATYQTYLKAPDDMPLMHVMIDSYARLDVTNDYVNDSSATQLQDAWFCASSNPEDCVCPTDDTGTAPTTDPVSALTELALTGDPGTGTNAAISYHSLDEYCHSTTKPSACSAPKSGCKLYAGSGKISGGFQQTKGTTNVATNGSFQFCVEVEKNGTIDSTQSQWALEQNAQAATGTGNGDGAETTVNGYGSLSGSLTRGALMTGTLSINTQVTVDDHVIPVNSSQNVSGLLPIKHVTAKGFSGDLTIRNEIAQQDNGFDTTENGNYTAKLTGACAVAQPPGT